MPADERKLLFKQTLAKSPINSSWGPEAKPETRSALSNEDGYKEQNAPILGDRGIAAQLKFTDSSRTDNLVVTLIAGGCGIGICRRRRSRVCERGVGRCQSGRRDQHKLSAGFAA